LLGLNIGSLGFLTALVREELAAAAPSIAKGRLRISPRLAMQTKIYRAGKARLWPCALNDVVVSRGDLSRLVRLKVKVGGQLVTEYVGDGLIISTPTGSTAYSLSAGGAVLTPEAYVLALTPIAPHSLTTRSLVVSAGAGVTVEVLAQHHSLVVQFDGQPGGKLQGGDRIEIAPAPAPVRLAFLPESDFFRILRQKLKWSGASV
jgi:NAD+ kinase